MGHGRIARPAAIEMFPQHVVNGPINVVVTGEIGFIGRAVDMVCSHVSTRPSGHGFNKKKASTRPANRRLPRRLETGLLGAHKLM